MRYLWTIVAISVAVPAAFGADDAARALVVQAIKAQGGADKLAKLRVMRLKAEGTMEMIPGQAAVPFVIEDWWQMPQQYKTASQFDLGGTKVNQTQVINGDSGWMESNGVTQAMPKEAVAEMKEQKYAEDLDRLGFLMDKGIALTALGQAKVGSRAAAGILVQSKGHRDVKLYFDKETGLLAKREQRLLDSGTGKEVTQEVLFGDYRETDGLKHYRTLTVYRDGKKVIAVTVVNLEFFTKLDNSLFTRP